jgi:hypothetical protein
VSWNESFIYQLQLYLTTLVFKVHQGLCILLKCTEAEYVALNETVREVKFIFQLLEIMGVKAERSAKILVDNVGSIFLSQNKTSGERTKHMDMKYLFIREQIQNDLVKVEFERTSENRADVFTKNLGSEKFQFHTNNILNGVS